ncbi:hypothetical protein M0804_002872 [Polistes exclamans]|nr:hypothetical protein M0804_002872 [Polistes exclamans]
MGEVRIGLVTRVPIGAEEGRDGEEEGLQLEPVDCPCISGRQQQQQQQQRFPIHRREKLYPISLTFAYMQSFIKDFTISL